MVLLSGIALSATAVSISRGWFRLLGCTVDVDSLGVRTETMPLSRNGCGLQANCMHLMTARHRLHLHACLVSAAAAAVAILLV
jgi:hypothetical protein